MESNIFGLKRTEEVEVREFNGALVKSPFRVTWLERYSAVYLGEECSWHSEQTRKHITEHYYTTPSD